MSLINASCVPLSVDEQSQWDRFNLAMIWIYSYIPCTICGIGILLNGVFLFFVITGMRQKTLSSKLYIFLVNKSIGDLLACVSVCTLIGIDMSPDSNQGLYYALLGVACLSYFSASLTYLALSLTKLIAIKYPLLYRRKVSTSLIIKALICTWPIALLLTLFGGEINLVYIFNNNATCKEQYQGAFAITCALLYELFFVAVVIACSSVLYLVYKHETRQRTGHSAIVDSSSGSNISQTGRSFHKLLAGFLVYVFCYCMRLFRPFYMFYYQPHVCEWRNNANCDYDPERRIIDSASILIIYSVLNLFTYYRLFIDPIVNVIIDRKMSMVIKTRFASIQSTVVTSDVLKNSSS